MANKKIQQVEGIGPKYAEVLRQDGITTTDELLKAGASRASRQKIASRVRLNETLILKWVNMCDLFRISGVAGQYAELLNAVGVDTVSELAHRNPEDLKESLVRANAQKRLVRQTPSLRLVTGWVEQAKNLHPVITH